MIIRMFDKNKNSINTLVEVFMKYSVQQITPGRTQFYVLKHVYVFFQVYLTCKLIQYFCCCGNIDHVKRCSMKWMMYILNSFWIFTHYILYIFILTSTTLNCQVCVCVQFACCHILIFILCLKVTKRKDERIYFPRGCVVFL